MSNYVIITWTPQTHERECGISQYSIKARYTKIHKNTCETVTMFKPKNSLMHICYSKTASYWEHWHYNVSVRTKEASYEHIQYALNKTIFTTASIIHSENFLIRICTYKHIIHFALNIGNWSSLSVLGIKVNYQFTTWLYHLNINWLPSTQSCCLLYHALTQQGSLLAHKICESLSEQNFCFWKHWYLVELRAKMSRTHVTQSFITIASDVHTTHHLHF